MSPLGRCVMQAELRRSSIEEEIRQLENKRKRLIQEQKEQERKDRTNRLCKRMGLFEKLLPDSITLTEEQFKTFLEKTVAAEHGRRLLAEMTAQNAATGAAIHAGGPVQAGPQPSPSPARTGPQNGAETDRAGDAEGTD